jgi:hypothetical protein
LIFALQIIWRLSVCIEMSLSLRGGRLFPLCLQVPTVDTTKSPVHTTALEHPICLGVRSSHFKPTMPLCPSCSRVNHMLSFSWLHQLWLHIVTHYWPRLNGEGTVSTSEFWTSARVITSIKKILPNSPIGSNLHAAVKLKLQPFWNGWSYGIKKPGIETIFVQKLIQI